MNHFKINLSFENRLHLNKKAGTLIHAFGEGRVIKGGGDIIHR